MAEGKPVGKMYVELSLDATKYTKSQKDILAGAEKNSADINKVFKTVGTQSDAMYHAMRQNIQNAYNAIAKSATSSAAEITRAHESAAKKIADIDRQQYGKRDSLITEFKANWMGTTAAITSALYTIKKAWDFVEWGAKSLQAEDSFRKVAAAAGESADKILTAMKRATAGTIDDSNLMQKAVKGITQGLTGEDLIRVSEAARVASRALGVEVSEAFERIIDSVANKTPKALKEMGLITTEQMAVFNKAVSSGAENVNLLDIVTANTLKHQELFGTLISNNGEKMKTFSVVVKNTWEELARFFSSTFTAEWNAWNKGQIEGGEVTAKLGRLAK